MISKVMQKTIRVLFGTVMPGHSVVKILDWDKDRYVVVAPRKGNKDEIDPYYSVNKHNGEIRPFYVGEDIIRFAKLMEESK